VNCERIYQTLDVGGIEQIEALTLNRPQALNALNALMIEELTDYFDNLADRATVRVVILRAAGRAFCAGVDFDVMEATDDGAVRKLLARQKQLSGLIRLMRACPQPIIALIRGAACGAGFSLALASDVRLADSSARMNAAYIKVGLGGCDLGCSYFLPRLIGASLASELMMTGRFIGAARAQTVGLFSAILPEAELDEAGLALGREMLLTSPLGLRLTKEALNINLDAPGLEAALALEDRQQILLSQTADHREAIAAFRERRSATFRDD
jgi:enoyl-CoA hydratase/carnithine racemase